MASKRRYSGGIDEVERCRRVRRELEREHKTLDGLFDWLTGLEKERKAARTRPTRRKRKE